MVRLGDDFARNNSPSGKLARTTGYLLLGMHRSGTSCLAGLLETSGLSLGDVSRSNRHNLKGNLEDKAVRAVNTAILQKFGGSWKCPPMSIVWKDIDARPVRKAIDRFSKHNRWLIKDPRMLLTIEAWLPHIPVYRLIGTFRHPMAVARSLNRRDEMPVEQGVALWTAYNQRLVDLHRRHQFPLVCFDQQGEAYLDQFFSLCQRLELTGDRQAACAFYERELVSQSSDGAETLTGEPSRLYDYLLHNAIPPCQDR